MKTTITMTSKGQFTLPAEVRKELNLKSNGDELQLEFDSTDRTVRLSKPITFSEVQRFVQANSDKTSRLPTDIHKWYEDERIRELKERDIL